MATKEQRNSFAKETRIKFKKATEEGNWRRVDACIQDMKGHGFPAVAKQMEKTRDELMTAEKAAKEDAHE